MYLSKKQYKIIISSVLILGCLLGFLSDRTRRQAIASQQREYSAELSQAIAASQQLEMLEAKLEKLEKEMESVESALPGDRKLGPFLQQMAAIMNKYGLSEQLIEPGIEIEGKSMTAIPVTMRASGKIDQLFSFYRDIKEQSRVVRIEEVILVNDPDYTGRLSMQTKAMIFYQDK